MDIIKTYKIDYYSKYYIINLKCNIINKLGRHVVV